MPCSTSARLLVLTLLIAGTCGLCVYLLAITIVQVEPAWRRASPTFYETTPVVGDVAPDFTLRSVGGEEFRLVDHLGKRPILLEFGSLSCPYCTRQLVGMRELAEKYRDEVSLVFIYCAEAHPAEAPPVLDWEARRDRAARIQGVLADTMPVLVDEFNGRSVQMLYRSLQNCAYMLGLDGRVMGKWTMATVPPFALDTWLHETLGRGSSKD